MALDADLAQQLTSILAEKLPQPIEIVACYDERDKSGELRGLLAQIAGMSPNVTVREADPQEAPQIAGGRAPGFSIRRGEVAVDFAGLPLGHEFSSLVLALVQVGGNPIKDDPTLLNAARAIDTEHQFVTYMSLTCQNCPTVVQALNAMAAVNPKIRHVAVEGSLFQAEIEDRGILAVPTVYLNGQSFGSGRMELGQILDELDGADNGRATQAAAAELSEREPYEVLVVGGGPAGVAAAIYAARKGIRTGLLAGRFGGQVNDTMAIENLISTIHTEGPALAGDLAAHLSEYEVDLIKNQLAASMRPGGPEQLHTVTTSGGATLRARSVILATGARWRLMDVPGEDEYRNRGVTFCPHCDGPLFKGKRVAVIGGGNSGVEAAIDLAGVAEQVMVLEFLDEMRADDVLLDRLHALPNVNVLLGTKTTEVVGDGNKVTGLKHTPREGGVETVTELEGVFVQIGLLPVTEWLGDTVALNDRNEIIVDERGATNVPGVFGAGDACSTPYKQIVVALGSGATAALSAFDHLVRTPVPTPA